MPSRLSHRRASEGAPEVPPPPSRELIANDFPEVPDNYQQFAREVAASSTVVSGGGSGGGARWGHWKFSMLGLL